MIEKLRFLKKTNWDEVFSFWSQNEEQNPGWQKCAQEKGWDNWFKWRTYMSNPLSPQSRTWCLFEIPNPNIVIPQFYLGPTKSWQNNFKETEYLQHTFNDLITLCNNWVLQNKGVQNIKEPIYKTIFWGIYIQQENRIYIFDGHHRATAISLHSFLYPNTNMAFTENPQIALMDLQLSEKHILFEILNQSSENPNKKITT